MPYLFRFKCSECNSEFAGPTHISMFKRGSGEWVELSHPSEMHQIMDIVNEDNIPKEREEFISRQGIGAVSFCKDCGERILTSIKPLTAVDKLEDMKTEDKIALVSIMELGTFTIGDNFQGENCKCSCKASTPIAELEKIKCPKCKKGKLTGGMFSIS